MSRKARLNDERRQYGGAVYGDGKYYGKEGDSKQEKEED